MDDDGSRSLDMNEFKKGLHDYGVEIKDGVNCQRVLSYTRPSCLPERDLNVPSHVS